jgi:uncharacterized membrane protein
VTGRLAGLAGLARLALVGAGAAGAIERVLASRGGAGPAPLRMLVVVDAPIDETWAVASDIAGQPEWMREMQAVRQPEDGPTRVGTRAEATIRILGITVRDPVSVTAFDPPTRFAIRHEGLFRGHGAITLEAGADGTTTIVRWEETLVPPLLPHLGAALGGPILRAIFQDDLHRLKRLVETGSAEG